MSELDQRAQTVSLAILAVVAVAFSLYWLRPVLIPFTLSVFIALALSPVVELQVSRLHMPRSIALTLAIILVIVALTGAGALVSSSVNSLAAHAADYQQNIRELVSRVIASLPESVWDIVPRSEIETLTRGVVGRAGSVVAQLTSAILSILSQGSIVLIFVMFLLIGGGAWSRPQAGTFGELVGSVRRYLTLNVAVSAATGLLVGLILYLLDVPLAPVFGLLAFLLNFIPTVGSIIAWALPLPVVFISPEVGPTQAVLAVVLPGLVQIVIGNIITPTLMGESLDLHPVVILIALIFWGMLWGPVGMVLATPLTAVSKILMSKNESTRPIAEIMAGRLDEWYRHA